MAQLDAVTGELVRAAAVQGQATPTPPVLRWGPLLAALDPCIGREYLTAMELIYEGYLLHYRQGRVRRTPSGDRREGLLGGDVLYARGLHLIASRGDVGAVDVLARLMASCSSLREREVPFSEDDALWAYAVGGLAALRQGAPVRAVVQVFDALDAALLGGACPRVREMARNGAETLCLTRGDVLEAELSSPLPVAEPGLGAVAS